MALTNHKGDSARILAVQSANMYPPDTTGERKDAAQRAYVEALTIPDPGDQLRARFKALMDLADARGG